MFWIQTIKSGDKYCICHTSWNSFRIVSVDVIDITLSIYLTAEDGRKSILLTMRRGELLPPFVTSISYQFDVNEHLKIEVVGGSIILVGNAYNGIRRINYTKRFHEQCVFNDFD